MKTPNSAKNLFVQCARYIHIPQTIKNLKKLDRIDFAIIAIFTTVFTTVFTTGMYTLINSFSNLLFLRKLRVIDSETDLQKRISNFACLIEEIGEQYHLNVPTDKKVDPLKRERTALEETTSSNEQNPPLDELLDFQKRDYALLGKEYVPLDKEDELLDKEYELLEADLHLIEQEIKTGFLGKLGLESYGGRERMFMAKQHQNRALQKQNRALQKQNLALRRQSLGLKLRAETLKNIISSLAQYNLNHDQLMESLDNLSEQISYFDPTKCDRAALETLLASKPNNDRALRLLWSELGHRYISDTPRGTPHHEYEKHAEKALKIFKWFENVQKSYNKEAAALMADLISDSLEADEDLTKEDVLSVWRAICNSPQKIDPDNLSAEHQQIPFFRPIALALIHKGSELTTLSAMANLYNKAAPDLVNHDTNENKEVLMAQRAFGNLEEIGG